MPLSHPTRTRLSVSRPRPQVCYAISQLASGFYEQRGTSAMSPYFKDVVQALLETVRGRRVAVF